MNTEDEIIGSRVINTGVNKQCNKHAPDRRIASLSMVLELGITY